jgi:hypothetical protein
MSKFQGAILLGLLAAAASPWPARAEIIHRHQLERAKARGLVVAEDYGAVLWMQPRSALQKTATDVSSYAIELGGRRFDPALDLQASAAP